MQIPCLICGENISDTSKRFSLSDRRKGLTGVWSLAECEHCGVVSMNPMPSEEELAIYYESYYSQGQTISFSRRRGSRYPALRRLFHQVSGDVDPRDFVQVPKGARVLDYGCGHAGYLSDFHERGVAISGAEIAGDVVEACRNHGYDVQKVNDFSHIPFPDDEFDIVYLMQVFEHLRDPHGFMKELARILKCGGMLYLAVPNGASIWRRVFGEHWVSGWFTPFHLFHYNSHSLAKLAGEHGFDVVESWSNTPVTWFKLNLKAILFRKENHLDSSNNCLDSRPLGYLLMLLLRLVEFPFCERDCLVIKLKKQN